MGHTHTHIHTLKHIQIHPQTPIPPLEFDVTEGLDRQKLSQPLYEVLLVKEKRTLERLDIK